MATPSLEDYKELFKQLEEIKVTFADGSPSTTMDKALAKVSTETNNNSNSSNNLNNSNNKRKGKGKNKMRSNL
jgi:hypothetical protein